MADATLQIGNGNWAVKPSLLLAYNVGVDGYNPIEMAVSRTTNGSRTNALGVIDYKDSNIARINYQNGVGSLLLEPERRNLVTYSEQFDNTLGWTKSFVTVTTDSIVSPSGTQNADAIIANTSSNFHEIIKSTTVTSGVQYSLSIFAKAGGYDYLLINSSAGSSSGNVGPLINLSNGTIIGSLGGNTYNAKVTAFPNSWYRIDLTLTTSATSLILNFNQFATSTIAAFTGNGTSGIYLWGAQLEQGSYPTSYIPTVASTVTRFADACSKTGISDLIGQTEGVIFIESATLFNDLTNRITSVSDGTTNNRIFIGYNSASNLIWAQVVIANTNVAQLTYTITNSTQFAKIAVRYSNILGYSLWVNGVIRGSNALTNIPPLLSRFGFDGGAGSSNFYSKTKQVQLYKTYLTDTEMTNLTTL